MQVTLKTQLGLHLAEKSDSGNAPADELQSQDANLILPFCG